MDINKWEMLLNNQVISPDVSNIQFNSLSRVIKDLAKEALLARVEFVHMWRDLKLQEHYKPNETEWDERD